MKKLGKTHCTRCGSNNRIVYNEVREGKCLTVCKDCKTEEMIACGGLSREIQKKIEVALLKDKYNEMQKKIDELEEKNITLEYKLYSAEHNLFSNKVSFAAITGIIVAVMCLFEIIKNL